MMTKNQLLSGIEFSIAKGNDGTSYRVDSKDDEMGGKPSIYKIYRNSNGVFLFEDFEGIIDNTSDDEFTVFHTVMGECTYVTIKLEECTTME